ncbi:DUF2755 family protein [Enterobacter cloacae subsp. cloacae]|nr:DUF2755 family protein [Enterobacter cloacae subsp. cloacae]
MSKPIFGGTPPKTSTAGNIAYALFVLFWLLGRLPASQHAGSRARRLHEHLMQVQDNPDPFRRLRLVWV